jgi:hypothetical protein
MSRRLIRFLLLFAALWLPVQTMAGMSISVCMNMQSHGGMAAHHARLRGRGGGDALSRSNGRCARLRNLTAVATTAKSAILPAPASCPVPRLNPPRRPSASVSTHP